MVHSKHLNQYLSAFCLALYVLLFAFPVFISQFGINLYDEASHVAMGYRLMQGDRPYIDEANPSVSAFRLTAPLISLYTKVQGSSEGLVLFLRWTFCFFMFGASVLMAYTVRGIIGWPAALICSSLAFLAIPFNLPSLSYMTMGAGFLGSGLWFIFHSINARSTRWSFVSGVLMGLAALCIPAYVFTALLLGAIILGWTFRGNKKIAMAYIAGGLVVFAIFGPALLRIPQQTVDLWSNWSIDYDWGMGRVFSLFGLLFTALNKKLLALSLLAFILLRKRWASPWVASLCWLVAASLILYFSKDYLGGSLRASMNLQRNIALIAPLGLIALGSDQRAKLMLVFVWMPSFLSGFGAMWSSANGLVSAGAALLPAAVVSLVFLVWALQKNAPSLRAVYALIPVPLLGLFLYCLQKPYHDRAIPELTVKMENGPYKGIYTNPNRYRQYAEVESILKRYEKPGRKLLILDHFPAGYLMTSMKPATLTIWGHSCSAKTYFGCDDVLVRSILNHLGEDVLVVKAGSIFLEDESYKNRALVQEHFRLVESIGKHQVYLGKKSG